MIIFVRAWRALYQLARAHRVRETWNGDQFDTWEIRHSMLILRTFTISYLYTPTHTRMHIYSLLFSNEQLRVNTIRDGIALTLRRFLSQHNTRWLSFTYTHIVHKCKYPFLWGSIREIWQSCRGLPWLFASKTTRRDPACSFIPSRRIISKFHREDAHNFILPPKILLLFSICTPPHMLASSSLSGMHITQIQKFYLSQIIHSDWSWMCICNI